MSTRQVTRGVTLVPPAIATKKRQRAVAAPPPSMNRLPAIIFHLIVQWIYAPQTLLALAGMCTAFRDAVHDLPPWHSSCLKGGSLFQGTAVPIRRALRLLIAKRCELCGKGSVHGFQPHPWGIMAHKACVDAALINTYYLTTNQRPRMAAAQAPSVHKEGMAQSGYGGLAPWAADYVWKEAHAALHPALTLSTVELMTMPEAAAAGQAYRDTRAAEDSMAHPLFVAEQAAEARALQAKATLSVDKSKRRRAALAAALAAEALPSIDDLCRTYGETIVMAKEYLGPYLSTRLTAPHSVDQGVARVRWMCATEATVASRNAIIVAAMQRSTCQVCAGLRSAHCPRNMCAACCPGCPKHPRPA